LSEESALDNKEEAIGFRIIATTDLLKECGTKLSKLDDTTLTEPSLLTKKELEKALKELDNQNQENSKYLDRVKNYGVNKNINEIEKINGKLLAFLALVVGFFLIAIIFGIVAFVYGSGRTLGESLIFIVLGMIYIFAVWYFFYRTSRVMRDFFRILLSTKTTLSMIAKCGQECKSKLDDVSNKINTLSKT